MSSKTEQHFLAGKTIVVAGAGISGLTFCIALQHLLEKNDETIKPPPCIVVYERETSTDVIGREGYSLSLRGNPLSGGMPTLQKLGMVDEIIAEKNPCTHVTLFNTDFTPSMEFWQPPVEDLRQPNIRIARSKLREIFVKHVPSSITVHWNCGITSAQELEDGRVLLDLTDGRQEYCDLLIAADGSNSKVRKALRPQDEQKFAGTICIFARTRALDKLPPPLDVTWGGVLGGNGHLLFVAPSDRTSVMWSVSYLSDTPCEVKPAGTMSETELDQILAEAEERLKPYGEPMPTLLKETLRSSVAVFNAKEMVPFRNHGSIIFIGDAQHAMSPFAGSGANMAIMDGYQLAEQLILGKSLSTAVKAYDDQSISRSTRAIKMSHWTIAMGHSQGIWKHLWVVALKVMAWCFGLNHRPIVQQQ